MEFGSSPPDYDVFGTVGIYVFEPLLQFTPNLMLAFSR